MTKSKGCGPNPSGLCMCGCEQSTNVAKTSWAKSGDVAGTPLRYRAGHQNSQAIPFVIDETTGCWLWKKPVHPSGYAFMWDATQQRMRAAHCVFYARQHGPIPEGMDLDHLCRRKNCVNPAHLEVVTHAENVRRGVSTHLTMADAHLIRELRSHGHTFSALATQFGVTKSTVFRIATNQSWVAQ